MIESREVTIVVNGEVRHASCDPRTTLVDFLRDALSLTGTHVGCEHGVCGACTILLEGESVRSCLLFAVQADGARITTVEGLSSPRAMNDLQLAFQAAHALQCGFCTPGILMTATAFLRENPDPTEAEVKVAISGNICRCTGYQPIIAAILNCARDRLAANSGRLPR